MIISNFLYAFTIYFIKMYIKSKSLSKVKLKYWKFIAVFNYFFIVLWLLVHYTRMCMKIFLDLCNTKYFLSFLCNEHTLPYHIEKRTSYDIPFHCFTNLTLFFCFSASNTFPQLKPPIMTSSCKFEYYLLYWCYLQVCLEKDFQVVVLMARLVFLDLMDLD